MLKTRMRLALFLALLLGGTTLAVGQGWQWRPGDGDHDRDDYSRFDRDDAKYYNRGFRDGQSDARHNRGFQMRYRRGWDRDDAQAYVRGYRAGYDSLFRRDDRRGYLYGQPGVYGYGQPGQYGRYGASPYNIGFEDGLRYDAQDRNTGHSFRPTNSSAYHDADRGFYGGYASKSEYKSQYRSGYLQGYQRGYYGR